MRPAALLALAPVIVWSCSGSHERGASVDAADASHGYDTSDAPGAGAATTAACEGVDAGSAASLSYVDLNITASGFTEHEGQTVFVVTRSNSYGVLGSGSAVVSGGAFAFHFPKGYRRAADQQIIWLLDADGDGVCDEAGGDHTGFFLLSATDPPGAE